MDRARPSGAELGWVGAGELGGAPATPLRGPGRDRGQDVLKGARVLVVEDEFMVAALLGDTLVALGCEVVGPAAEVSEALAILEREPIDAAVLDVNIGGEMVFPVADALAARELPFVFATAYGVAGVADRHKSRAVLDKPYHQRALEHALRSALQRRRGGRH